RPDSAPITEPDSGITEVPMMKYALSPADDEKTLEALWPFLTRVCDRIDESRGHLRKDGQMSPATELPVSMKDRISKQRGGLTTLRDAPGNSLNLPLRNAEYFMIGLLGRGGGLSDELNVAGASTYDDAKDHPNSPTGIAIRLLIAIKGGSWNMQ